MGCTDSNANNYDQNAEADDGSCVISGCTDAHAQNYDSSVHVDDGSCTYEVASDTATLLQGRWILRQDTLAACVGPHSMSCEWWHTTLTDMAARPCFFDDIYHFKSDGTSCSSVRIYIYFLVHSLRVLTPRSQVYHTRMLRNT